MDRCGRPALVVPNSIARPLNPQPLSELRYFQSISTRLADLFFEWNPEALSHPIQCASVDAQDLGGTRPIPVGCIEDV